MDNNKQKQSHLRTQSSLHVNPITMTTTQMAAPLLMPSQIVPQQIVFVPANQEEINKVKEENFKLREENIYLKDEVKIQHYALKTFNEKLEAYEISFIKQANQIGELQQTNKEHVSTFQKLSQQVETQTKQIKTFISQIEEQQQLILQLQSELQGTIKENTMQKQQITELEHIKANQNKQIQSQIQQIEQQALVIKQQKSTLDEQTLTISKQIKSIDDLEKTKQNQTLIINSQKETINELTAENYKQQNQLQDLLKINQEQSQIINEQIESNQHLKEMTDNQTNIIEHLQKENQQILERKLQNKELSKLLEDIQILFKGFNDLKNSRSFSQSENKLNRFINLLQDMNKKLGFQQVEIKQELDGRKLYLNSAKLFRSNMSMDLSTNNKLNQLSEMIENSPTKSLPAKKNVMRSQSTFTGGVEFNNMLSGGGGQGDSPYRQQKLQQVEQIEDSQGEMSDNQEEQKNNKFKQK